MAVILVFLKVNLTMKSLRNTALFRILKTEVRQHGKPKIFNSVFSYEHQIKVQPCPNVALKATLCLNLHYKSMFIYRQGGGAMAICKMKNSVASSSSESQ